MTDRTHDEFCFNTDLYQDDVEGYMCICNRLDQARHQERIDEQELSKAAIAAAEQRGRHAERAERMADAANGVGHWIHCPHCGHRHDITFAYNCGQADMLAKCIEVLSGERDKWFALLEDRSRRSEYRNMSWHRCQDFINRISDDMHLLESLQEKP